MRFQIGQHVYRASFTSRESSVECPDCGGTGRLRVTFHDETQVSIECSNCRRGYDPPSGRIRVLERVPEAILCTIIGVDIRGDETNWRTSDSHYVAEEDLFVFEDPCLARARAIAEEASKEERDRIYTKEKDTRSWAFNASYHRNCIKRAQKEIEYHSAKLAVASLKAKEDRKAMSDA